MVQPCYYKMYFYLYPFLHIKTRRVRRDFVQKKYRREKIHHNKNFKQKDTMYFVKEKLFALLLQVGFTSISKLIKLLVGLIFLIPFFNINNWLLFKLDK